MTELLHAPGFLGTNGNFAADATLVLMILIALLFTVGFALARQDKIRAHKWVQTSGAAANLALVLWLMVLPFRDFVLRDQGGPRLAVFYTVTRVHAVLGVAAILFGLYVVLRGHKLLPAAIGFNNYRPFMRAAYGLYVFNTLVGAAVYLIWFVVVPNPPVY